jgi:hypothetical protein
VIDDVAMSSITGTCIQLTGVDDVVIRDSRATACNRAVMMVGVHRATIARLSSASTTTAGVAMAGGSADIEVRQTIEGACRPQPPSIGPSEPDPDC